ncbi:MAG: anti-sigma factor family protein [Actinomycetes bacterium]
MTALTCADARLSLGAYVLGALDGEDRAAVEAHLAHCASCRDELTDIAPLPGLLARIDEADLVAGDPAPPPELLDRLLRAASTERRNARRWRVMAAAAVVAIASAGAAAAAAQIAEGHGSRPAAAVSTLSATDPVSHVTARISAAAKTWGTAVRVQLAGVREGETCSLVVTSRTGQHEVAASWRVNYTGSVDVEGATEWPTSDIASYDVVTSDGHHLVSVRA